MSERITSRGELAFPISRGTTAARGSSHFLTGQWTPTEILIELVEWLSTYKCASDIPSPD